MKEAQEIVVKQEDREVDVQAQQEKMAAIRMARMQSEFNEFLASKSFVLENLHVLRGRKVSWEVHSIQNLPKLECVILDDIVMLPYRDVEEQIKEVLAEQETARINQAIMRRVCPEELCCGRLNIIDSAFEVNKHEWLAGMQCEECDTMYDFNDNYKGLMKAIYKARRVDGEIRRIYKEG